MIQSEESLKDMLLKARPIGHDSIVSFTKLRHEVYIELAQIEQVSGVKVGFCCCKTGDLRSSITVNLLNFGYLYEPIFKIRRRDKVHI